MASEGMNEKSGQRIAVIGSGISGLSAAWLLAKRNDVVLYEAEGRPGGHSRTIDVEMADGSSLGVDTGFIVFNDRTYPNRDSRIRGRRSQARRRYLRCHHQRSCRLRPVRAARSRLVP